MRPNSISHCLKSLNVKSARSIFGRATLIAVALAIFAPPTIGCMSSPPDESAEIALPLGAGVNPKIQLSLYRNQAPDSTKTTKACSAFVEIPLSAFPSTSNRFGTSEIAAAIRERVDAWEADECRVILYYTNDTKVDLAEHELCVTGAYGFEKGDFWSSDTESFCWEPADMQEFEFEVADTADQIVEY